MNPEHDVRAVPEVSSGDAADDSSSALVTESVKHSTAEEGHTETAVTATSDTNDQQPQVQPPETSRTDEGRAPPVANVSSEHEGQKQVDEQETGGATRSPTNAKSGNKQPLPADRELLPLLSLPPSARLIVVEEHESHRARLEAIAAGRSTSQATALSYLSTISGTRSPRKLDPCVETHHQNHKRALANIQHGGLKHSLVHVTHYKRLGNTFAVPEEFLDPKHPEHRVTARESRLYHNSYRNGRLMAAERVDEANAKFVTALIHVKPVLPSAISLLEQERERQVLLRRIERGPVSARTSTTAAVSPSNASDDAAKREAQWDNHVNPRLPKPPHVGSVISSHDVSQPHVLWQTKIRLSREQERTRLLEAVSGAQESVRDAPAGGSASENTAQTKPPKQERVFRPKPPAVGLSACIEKMPSVSSGRHAGKPVPDKGVEVKPRVSSFRHSPAASTSNAHAAPESEAHTSPAPPPQGTTADAQAPHTEAATEKEREAVPISDSVSTSANASTTVVAANEIREECEGQATSEPTVAHAERSNESGADNGPHPGVEGGEAARDSTSIQA